MKLSHCKICGKLFYQVGNSPYCSDPHYRPCPICGKPVEFKKPSAPRKCCSKECTNIKRAETKRNNLPMRKCEICGKLYQPNDTFQKYCSGPHETTCVICGKSVTYTCHPADKPKTCSEECKEELRMRTNIEHCGYRNPAHSPEARKKISVANSTGGKGANKRKSTLNAIYGEGINNPFQIPSVIELNKKLYNDPEFIAHKYDAYKKKTGYDSPGSNPETHRKRLETRAEHDPYESFTRKITEHHMLDSSKLEDFLEFKSDPKKYILTHYDYKPTIEELRIALGVTDTPIYDFLNLFDAGDYISRRRSSIELTIQHFIESLGIIVEPNNRKIIPPKEIDLWIPDYNIGIEFNPTFTHNSTTGGYSSTKKPKNYHMDKSIEMRNIDSFLFHIFGWEWKFSKDIILSMLCDLFGKSTQNVNSINLTVKDVSYEDASIFLNTNHLQGEIRSEVNLGLYSDDDELLSMMSFNSMRATVGEIFGYGDHIWELSRFCNKLNTSIPNSEHKLLDYFIHKYNPKKIITFSDDAHISWEFYKHLGFTNIYTTEPRYMWVDKNDKVVYNQVECQKNKLRRLFNDKTIDVEHRSEADIMEEHGFLQVFDSGLTKWEMCL